MADTNWRTAPASPGDLFVKVTPPADVALLQAEVQRLQKENARLEREKEFLEQLVANTEQPRLVTVHICATELGVSASYPEGAKVGDVVGKLWAYIQRAKERDPEFRLPRPIRGRID